MLADLAGAPIPVTVTEVDRLPPAASGKAERVVDAGA